MKNFLRLSLFIFLVFACGLPATAGAAPKIAGILQFGINAPQSYAYLAKAVPATIQARLNRPGALEVRQIQVKASSQTEARKAADAHDMEYAVWGTVSVLNNDCAVTVNSVDRAGKTWSKTARGPLSSLTSTVQNLTAAMGHEVFSMPVAGAGYGAAGTGSGQPVNRMNPDIVVNETGQQQVYLNPQFRYQGAGANDGSRIRSQRIKEKMVDMAVGDFNGDGKNEIAVLTEHKLAVYSWEADGKLKPLGETMVSQSNLNFSMRAMDLDRDGARELVVATYEEESNRPYSYFFSFKGNRLAQCAERCPYFASVVNAPPNFTPTLVGQAWDSVRLFAPGVREMVKSGNKYTLAAKLDLPEGANAFNITWIPGGKDSKSPQLVMLTDDERLKIFQGAGNTLIHTTTERFSGSATGMEFYKTMPGMGIDRSGQLPSRYYAPMRMIAADPGHTGEYVLLLNKPISTASQIFDRYRYFPLGEIHAMYWDGVGLALKWKTRRIRGSVAEVDLADVNNDGVLDLVAGVNTSPDLGIGSRQSMILAYPLDLSQTNPNTPADLSDFEISPNP
ncbi:MAG: VCBS repeat-containing protein [Desulfovibrio sp.]|jgi:hypothetical protein|nr:VCBS repeat-containing protein [Desulfovibrio sp.]